MTSASITTRSRRRAGHPRSLLLVALLLLAHVGCVECSVSGQFTQVTVAAPYPPRFAHFAFAWAGSIWVAGGEYGQIPKVDVWGSYDYGRSWHQPKFSNGTAVNLPGFACTLGSRGVIYNDSVYLVSDCSEANTAPNLHGSSAGNDYWTYVSRDPALISWTTLKDDCAECNGFSVERMAVPFDGVGTLIMVNPNGNYATLNWQSATGNFQSATPGHGVMNKWTQWKASSGGAAYTVGWGARYCSATATDAEGLVLILTGGSLSGMPNDVWQLSWSSSFAAPLVYQVTSSAKWEGRMQHRSVMVHDWLFIYGGLSFDSDFDPFVGDDAWMSGDYGATWTQYNLAATGNARYLLGGLSLGRRLFITGGLLYSQSQLQDVYVSYW